MSNPLTVAFSENEREALKKLAAEKDLTETATLRQALRLYQKMHILNRNGCTFFVQHKNETGPRSLELLI